MRYVFTLILLFAATMTLAAPANYNLQADRSEVGFVYTLSGAAIRGSMPVRSAQILIDIDQFSNSSVDVTLDVSRAKAGLVFATEALKSESVLSVSTHPSIRFKSTAVRLNNPRNLSQGGKIDGLLTIRNVTKPVTLDTALFLQPGSAEGDFSRLSFRISGAVKRSDFGASGYGDLVNDVINIDIAARVVRAQ